MPWRRYVRVGETVRGERTRGGEGRGSPKQSKDEVAVCRGRGTIATMR